MHRPVIPVAQEHQVLKVGIAAVAPVQDVMPVNAQM